MPRIRHTDGPGRFAHAALERISTYGDTHEVDDGAAEYLCEDQGYFERVEATDVEFTEVDDGDGSGGQEDESPDVDEWGDWTEEAWLELDYKQRADDVSAGRVDDHLDEIEDVETSDTVTDAVEQRRDELEE